MKSISTFYLNVLGQGVFNTTLYDKVCQLLAAGQWISPVSSINKTDYQDITELLLRVVYKPY